MKTIPAKHFLLASDFDQTLSFNDSGIELSELLGIGNFEHKVAGLAHSHLVQQGGELAYLIRHDPEYRGVRREHLIEAGRRVRLKSGLPAFVALLDQGIAGHQFSFYVVSAAPREVVVSALDGIVPAAHIFGKTVAACEALSRVVALRLSRLRGGNAVATPDDYGFVLTVTPAQVFGVKELPHILSPHNFEEDLREALSRSDLLKYHFRNAAQTGMMVYRNYFGERKSVRKLQWSSEIIFNVLMQYEPDHVLLREAWRDAIHVYIDSDGARRYLEAAASRPMRIRTVDRVPPLSFALFATKIKEALKVEDPRETMERLFHLWWSKIEPEGSAATS